MPNDPKNRFPDIRRVIAETRADLLRELEKEINNLETLPNSTTDGYKEVVLYLIRSHMKE